MKYLILGSEGQIGYSLKKYLVSKGNEVIEFDIVNSFEQDLRLHNNSILKTCVNITATLSAY